MIEGSSYTIWLVPVIPLATGTDNTDKLDETSSEADTDIDADTLRTVEICGPLNTVQAFL